MPQSQKIARLAFKDGTVGSAVAAGSSAAWRCPCGRAEPLVGRVGSVLGPTPMTEVHCPESGCGRHFFVVSNGHEPPGVLYVEELGVLRGQVESEAVAAV